MPILVSVYGDAYIPDDREAKESREKFIQATKELFNYSDISFVFHTSSKVSLPDKEDFLVEVNASDGAINTISGDQRGYIEKTILKMVSQFFSFDWEDRGIQKYEDRAARVVLMGVE